MNKDMMAQKDDNSRPETEEVSRKNEKSDISIEESFKMLDSMVKKLEDEDISLEDSFRTYEEGMKLLKEVNEKVCDVEKKMQKIDDEGRIGEFE